MPCFVSRSWKYFLNRVTPNISLLILHTVSHISHLEKIRPHYFLLVLFNISSENLVSNQLFFQLLITCLLELQYNTIPYTTIPYTWSVRYCKEKLHPDQYWEWRFSIGQTNSKCTFLVTLRKKKLFKVRKPSWKVCWFLCKITIVVWHLCGRFILEGTSFKSFLFAVLPSYDTYSNREALRPQERTRTSTWRSNQCRVWFFRHTTCASTNDEGIRMHWHFVRN